MYDTISAAAADDRGSYSRFSAMHCLFLGVAEVMIQDCDLWRKKIRN